MISSFGDRNLCPSLEVVASKHLDPTTFSASDISKAFQLCNHWIIQHQAKSHLQLVHVLRIRYRSYSARARSEVNAEFSVSAHLPNSLRRMFPSKTPLQNPSTPNVAAAAMLLCAQVKTPPICKLPFLITSIVKSRVKYTHLG